MNINYRELVDKNLTKLFEDKSNLKDSMAYSVLVGGKRIRPILALEFCRICGGDYLNSLDIACAIEMVHTYSLIHDDLPCMDNDDLRRGKPTNHIIYGEANATLAGDALQSYAFETILKSDLACSIKSECALVLSQAIGADGMCLGQYLDIDGEGKQLSADQLSNINYHKTGDLIAASCKIGCILAGADKELCDKAAEFGYKIGLAFQIRDDMLDVLSTSDELGKPIGSDAEENKNTYMVLLGEKGCIESIHELTSSAIEILHSYFSNSEFLEDLSLSMETRVK